MPPPRIESKYRKGLVKDFRILNLHAFLAVIMFSFYTQTSAVNNVIHLYNSIEKNNSMRVTFKVT